MKPRRSNRPKISAIRPAADGVGLDHRECALDVSHACGMALPSRPLRRRRLPALAGRRGRRGGRHRSLAVRAEPPARVERRLAAAAGVLQLGAAVRAGQEAGIGGVTAVRAGLVGAQPALHGPDLELALVHVGQVLRRAQQHVHEHAHEREQRGGRDAHADDHGIVDAAARVLRRPEHQRQVERDQEDDEQALARHHVSRVEERVNPGQRVGRGSGGCGCCEDDPREVAGSLGRDSDVYQCVVRRRTQFLSQIVQEIERSADQNRPIRPGCVDRGRSGRERIGDRRARR